MSADRAKAASFVAEHAPVEIGVVEQPILRVTSGDVEQPAHFATAHAVGGFQAKWVIANCCSSLPPPVRIVAPSEPTPPIPLNPSPAVFRRAHVCRPRVPVSFARSGTGSERSRGPHRRWDRQASDREISYPIASPRRSAAPRDLSTVEPRIPATAIPARRKASTWTGPINPVPITAAVSSGINNPRLRAAPVERKSR